MEAKFQEAIIKVNTKEVNFSIGIQNEKILHKIIKYYINSNPNEHEVKIKNLFVDVVVGDHLYEIQTANFNNLRQKLNILLPNYLVTIVYPVSHKKTIYNLNEQGELLNIKISPKIKTPLEILIEMYKIKSFVNHPNLSFKVIYLDMDEYRTQVEKKHFRSKGYVRLKQVPTILIKEYDLKNQNDYFKIFSEFAFPNQFTTKTFSKYFKISTSKAANAISVLKALNIVELIGREGRRNLWQQKNI